DLEILGIVLMKSKKPAEAEVLLREALTLRQAILGGRTWQTANTENVLAATLAAQGRFQEAQPILESTYETLAAAPGVPPRQLHEAADRLVKLYTAWAKPDLAARWRTVRD